MSAAVAPLPDDCVTCGRGPTADFEGRALCYDHWHQAREATPPYHVRSASNPVRCSHAAFIPVVYTLAEAIERAAEMGEDFAPVPAQNWSGERLAHPGYMARRRAAVSVPT